MKTVSTKVDESVYQKLIESCGKSGNCVSEKIRNLIDESLEISKQQETSKKTSRVPVLHLHWEGGKLIQDETTWEERPPKSDKESHYDEYGNYWYFDKGKQKWVCRLNI